MHYWALLFVIVRKRKGSVDDNVSDSHSSQKKPRVYFSDEQKEALRHAYDTDAYPSQAVIDKLADDLGIGSKTVINWFHNHRMRAKQHYACWSPSSGAEQGTSVGSSSRRPIKSEMSEDFSSQSCDDSASDSGRVAQRSSVSDGGAMAQWTDSRPLPAQWGLSPVNTSCLGGSGSGGDQNSFDDSSRSLAMVATKAEETDAMDDNSKDLDVATLGMEQLDDERLGMMSTGVDRSKKNNTGGVNKRKSARPQRVSADMPVTTVTAPVCTRKTSAIIDLSCKLEVEVNSKSESADEQDASTLLQETSA